jgi:hypothetical protein
LRRFEFLLRLTHRARELRDPIRPEEQHRETDQNGDLGT